MFPFCIRTYTNNVCKGGMCMFGRIGTMEVVVILAIALIVVGPGKLPELGKSLGKAFSEFKKFSSEIKEDLSLDDDDPKQDS
jgi:sec-independent protein translocase protein TatA